MQTIKCVAIGDGSVGKTCMLISYTQGVCPSDYVPTVFENYAETIEVKGRLILLEIWDTAGQENYDRLRPLAYPNTDVALLCFSLVDRASFENIERKWVPEFRHHCPYGKIILIGTKSDLKGSLGNPNHIRREEGYRLAKRINAFEYLECSAVTKNGLIEVFHSATMATLEKSAKHKKTWCVLL